jgi:hypothetical protein
MVAVCNTPDMPLPLATSDGDVYYINIMVEDMNE